MRAVGRQPAAGARARESRQADARRQTEAEPAEEERPFLKAWRFCCHLPWPGAPASPAPAHRHWGTWPPALDGLRKSVRACSKSGLVKFSSWLRVISSLNDITGTFRVRRVTLLPQ